MVYEVGLRWIALMILLPPALIFAIFLYRAIRRSFRNRARAQRLTFDRLLVAVAENHRLLQVLVAERDSGRRDDDED
jgi:hypothetical protein